MMTLTWRHLFRHWRLSAAVLVCLTLACGLAAILSGDGDTIAARELSRMWEAASPSQRSLLITGPRDTFTDELYANLQDKLGGLVQERIVIRHASVAPDPPFSTVGMGQGRPVSLLDVYSFEPLVENVRVVEGRLPESVDLMKDREPWRPPPIQAVLGVHAAAQSGYHVGDQLTASSKYHRVDIVGIVEPLDPHADIWGEDLSAFTPITSTLPLIIDSYSMLSFYPLRPVFPHEVSWRITLNPERLRVDNAAALHSSLINIQTQSATMRAVTSTGLVQILADYLAQLSRLRMAFWLLIAQTLIVVLYALAIFASSVVERSHGELAILSGRGASAWQITRVLALEKLVLAALAVIVGPTLASGAIGLGAASTGDTMPLTVSGETWALSGVTAAFGWLAMIWLGLLAARHNQVERNRWHARPPQTSAVQKRYVDLYLLAFGALLYWQLNQADSFVMSRLGNTFLADPLLLIGPTLLLTAGAMVLLRVLPLLLQPAVWLVQNWRGLTLSQVLLRLSQDSPSSQVVLLVSLTTALVVFGEALAISLGGSAEIMARDMASALQLNALALVLFSGTIFFLVYLFAAQGRTRESALLHALGFSWHQWLTLLIVEGVLVLCLGLVSGAVVGLGLSRIMLPYLAQALAGSPLGAIEQATVSGQVVAQSYVLLIWAFGSALILLGVVLAWTGERWAAGREDE